MTKKRKKINSSSSNIFVGFELDLSRKFCKFINKSWLLITWILKKSNSIQTLVEDIPEVKLSHCSLLNKTYRNSYSITKTFCFILIITLSFFKFSVIGGQLQLLPFLHTVIVIYKVLFYFSWPADIMIGTILFWNLFTVETSNAKQSVEIVVMQLIKKPQYFCHLISQVLLLSFGNWKLTEYDTFRCITKI